MEFRVLGPVEVWMAGHAVDAGQPRQRLVLAALLADVGGPVVPPEVLVDRVWGDRPPPSARRSLHAHITRIRRMLERHGAAPGRLPYRNGGYVLEIDPEMVDLHRFQRLVDRAREAKHPDSERAAWLRDAVALWRGQPLGGLPGDWAARTREEWQRRRLDATVAWGRAELRLGNPDAVIGALTALADEYPYEEPVAAVLLRALHGAGRSAGALERYATLRRRFGDELGTEPGPELQRLHQMILRGDPDPVPPARKAPAQLPADVGFFTGREREQRVLDAVVTRQAAEPATSVPIVAISGTAGVGKTALAVHWGHQVAARFPDGQVYLDLRGYDPAEPVAAADALVRLLTAVGVPERQIPPEQDERAARFRTEIAGRRMLIILDNTNSAEQVRPLLPGSPSCMVIVTSRDTLAGLVALHGAHRIELDLLPQDEAAGLLRHLIGPRVDAEPAAARTLTVLCARLPLALRIAAELVAGQPTRPLAALVNELSDEQTRLELLDSGDDPRAAVTAVFSWSVAKLRTDEARTFGLLGLHPGPDLDRYAAAALTGGGLPETRRTLTRLARAYLVQPTRAGRYGMHDLLRVYAAGLVAESERAAAVGRLFDHYLATAWAAMDVYYPAERPHRPAPPAAATLTPAFAGSSDALAWLSEERPNLLAVARHAAFQGSPAHAVGLSAVLYRHLDASGEGADALALHCDARQAAVAAGDRHGEALALLGIGTALMQVRRFEAAAEHLTESAETFRRLDDPIGEGRALNTLGIAHRSWGRLAVAVPYHQAALRLFRRADEPSGEGHALASLGAAARQLGRSAEAADYNLRALEVYRRAGDRCGQARALNNLGLAEIDLGRLEQALGHLEQACAVFAAEGDQRGEASVLDSLGGAHLRLGSHRRAADYFTRSIEAFRRIDCPNSVWPLSGLGEIALDEGRPGAALGRFTEVLGLASEAGSRLIEAHAHSGAGRAHHALGNRLRAREHCSRALQIFHELHIRDIPRLPTLQAVLDGPD